MLKASEITVRFRQRTLLQRVSLDLNPGEFVVIAGINGAGKSTLLKILSGEVKPDQGEVSLHGQPLSQCAIQELAKYRAVLAQENQLFFPFRGLEVVIMGRHAHHQGYPTAEDYSKAHALMNQLGVGHLADRTFPSLSGGEKARIQLARTLFQLRGCSSPPVLLLDEPTASLDLGHQQMALSAARQFICEEGGAVCAVLHDLNLAAQYADRIVILHDGGILADGHPEQVLTADIIQLAFSTRVVVIRHPGMNCPLVVTQP